MYVEVSIPIALFKNFTYIVPHQYRQNLFLGQSVTIPFKNQKINGFITEIKSKTNYKGKLLSIISVNENSLPITNELWKTLNWISKYYFCPLGRVLHNTISYQHKRKYITPLMIYAEITAQGKAVYPQLKYKLQKKVLEILDTYTDSYMDINKLKKDIPSYLQVCKRLEKNKYIKLSYIDNVSGILKQPNNQLDLKLSSAQQKVFSSINSKFKIKNQKPILLSGVPSSGKTMVYIKTINYYINKGQNVIVLVPEISLIKQVFENINNYYPQIVGIWHGQLKQTEKNYTLKKIKANKIQIIVGTRSCLFIPFMNLGLIVVDEEQEPSYKQKFNMPFYHARDVALMRSKFSNSSLLLVSSAPSIESYFNIKNDKYYHFHLEKKFLETEKLSKIHLVDMVNQKGILSDVLIKHIRDTLNNNEQIILLHNKKGMDNAGIQKVESIIYKFFPDIKILRYDGDTIKKSNEYYNILNTFKNGDANILLGTQIIAKGLDFDNVSLVGIISADIGLYVPDFRSGERTFQLIYQLIGRAGRNGGKSMAVVQSHNVNDFYIKNTCELKLSAIYNQILKDRLELDYPPYSRLIKILFLSTKNIDAKNKAYKYYKILKNNSNIKILGPAIAPIEYIKPYWRYQILIKCNKNYWQKFHSWLEKNISFSDLQSNSKNLKIKIDVDPISTL